MIKEKNIFSVDVATPEELEHIIDAYLSTGKYTMIDWGIETDGMFRSCRASFVNKEWLAKIKKMQKDEAEDLLVENIAEKLFKKMNGVKKK